MLRRLSGWISASGWAHFDTGFAALRVVAPTIRRVWDAHRPSLCLGALSSLSVIEDDGDHPTAGITQLRGPFAGGAPSWKRGFAFSCYQQRLEAEASTPVPVLPQPPASLAARLGVSAEDLHALLNDPRYAMPHADVVPVIDAQDRQVLDSVEVCWRSAPHGPCPPSGGPDAYLDPMPFTNRPTPSEEPTGHKRTPALPQPAPLRFRDMLLDSRKQRQMVDYLARLQTALRRGSNLRKPFILTDQDLKPEYRGRPFDIRDLDNVLPLDDSDVDFTLVRPGHRNIAAIQRLLPDYCDKLTLWSLRYGVPTFVDDDMPQAIILSPPNASALPHLQRLAHTDEESLAAGWATSYLGVPSFPFSAHPVGMDVKYTANKIKYRELSDYSGPHLPGGNDSYALNQHVHPEDVHLTSIRNLCRAAGVMRAGSRHVRSDAHYLRLTQVVVDAQAMYRAFDTRQKDKVWQGKAALDLDGVLRILRSERCEFGGNWLPRSASTIAACIDACARVIYWKWDDELCRLAVEDPSALLAANLCPLSYRQWKQERRSSIHEEPELSSAHFSEAYLDDELAFFLGALRALMFMLIYCRVLRLFGLEPSIGKLKIGDGLTLLGVDFFLQDGVCLPSEDKLRLYEAWTTRIMALAESKTRLITKEELESFNGSVNFGAFAIADARIHLRHFFKLATAKFSPNLRRKGLCPLHPSSISHAEAIRSLFRSSNGLAFLEKKMEGSDDLVEGWTDANHRFGDYCGMGGYVEKLRVWWYYEFDDQEVLRLLKVHILEMLADVVQIALVGTLARGCRYRGWIDNQSSMFAIRGQNSRDPKLMELLYVRHAILRREAVRPEASAYVASEDNISDPISRGKI